MKSKFTGVCGTVLLMLTAAACGSSNPLQPTTGTAGGAKIGSISVTTPQANAALADGAQIPNVNQPLTLVISNAVSTSSTTPQYTFEVASDSGFSTIVYTKTGVAQGANGQTSLTIDRLKPSTTYYWRARAVSGDTVGPAPQAKSFTVGPEVILQTPQPSTPAQNGNLTGTANLVVNNVQRTGPAGQISYQFDVSDSSSFGSTNFSTKVNEQAGSQTSVTVPTSSLTSGNTYFWRVQATDTTNGVTTAFSNAFSFKYTAFDPSKAIFLDNPSGVGSWAETATITFVDMGAHVVVDFDKRSGPGRWPESGFGNDGAIQYTLGMCFNINGQWYCSAAIQFWEGRELEAGGLTSEIARNWYYDGRWGAMQGHQPQIGEDVAIFVAQGNLRDTGNTSVFERSNFLVIPFGTNYSR